MWINNKEVFKLTDEQKLKKVEELIGYTYNDISLLKLALTHKSYAYEKGITSNNDYNERIEYLGDAILEHIISDMLYNDKKVYSEGEMTKKRAAIVCETSLSLALKEIGLQDYIYLGKCETQNLVAKKDAIIADCFEAILGSIYIDGGYDKAKEFVLTKLSIQIKEVLEGKDFNTDYKTKLQEILQKNGSVKIEYKLLKEEGPEHNKTFYVEVVFNGKKIGEGVGKNKKSAEQAAAAYAIKRI